MKKRPTKPRPRRTGSDGLFPDLFSDLDEQEPTQTESAGVESSLSTLPTTAPLTPEVLRRLVTELPAASPGLLEVYFAGMKQRFLLRQEAKNAHAQLNVIEGLLGHKNRIGVAP